MIDEKTCDLPEKKNKKINEIKLYFAQLKPNVFLVTNYCYNKSCDGLQ